jgi:hypothetical protein
LTTTAAWIFACLPKPVRSFFAIPGGRFASVAAALPQRRFERAVWIDYDHDYDLDLVLLGDSPALMRNQGSAGFADRTADFPFVRGRVTGALKLRVLPDSKAFDLAVFFADRAPVLYADLLGGRYKVATFTGSKPDEKVLQADFNQDGIPDRARISEDGKVHVALSRSPSANRWIRIHYMASRASNWARTLRWRSRPVCFTASSSMPEFRCCLIPNGLIQNEIRQATNHTYTYKEAQRLSGSCPMVWTWDGRGIRFITDVLGVAPLGASDGDGSYFPVDHDEYVTIPAAALAAADGQYDIRLT